MRIALAQMTSGIDPAVNAVWLSSAIAEAAKNGAEILFTPEMSGMLDRDRNRARSKIARQEQDLVLAAILEAARTHKIAVQLGSLALDPGGDLYDRLVNRGFFIDENGAILTCYDKMHMFDVALGDGDNWQESAAYRPGTGPAIVDWNGTTLGLSICYDLRFPALYQFLSGAGAQILSVPAAFTRPTGLAHWEVLLRARAIENAAFVVAAAQTGEHEDGRQTHGHSMVVAPWGRVLLDMGTEPGIGYCEIDLSAIDEARSKIPVLAHRRPIGDNAA